jgi:hypothetical protein
LRALPLSAVATLLTLTFLPALYVTWFRIEKPLPNDLQDAVEERAQERKPLHNQTKPEHIL